MTETGCTYLGLPDDDDEILSTTVGYSIETFTVRGHFLDKFYFLELSNLNQIHHQEIHNYEE
jgi:hypothetical protein